MGEFPLLFRTGVTEIDRILSQTMETIESGAPGRVRAFYLDGSLADGNAIATSDLDLTLVVSGRFVDDDERARLQAVRNLIIQNAPVELDIKLIEEQELAGGLTPMFKHASRLLYGQEIRDQYPLLPAAVWARERMHAAYWLMNRVFGRPNPVRFPLDYPNAGDLFFGYARRVVRDPDGTIVPSTRDLVRVSGWIATALIAHQAGRYVIRKRDCHRDYRAYIGDQWSELLEEIYDHCRTDWNYLIPANVDDRRRLRAICRRMLAFENHFLSIYRELLLEQLREGAPRALWLMEQLPLDDPAVYGTRPGRSKTE